MDYTIALCDDNGCEEKATSMVKIGMAYGVYCDAHGKAHEEARLNHIDSTNRNAFRTKRGR